jgi:hypothetical protein
MKKMLIVLVWLCCASIAMAQPETKDEAILRSLANSQHRLNFAVTAARLRTNTDVERAYRDLDTMLYKEYGDMFWMYGMAGLYHSTKDILPDTIKQSMREAWKHLTPYRGDTENHFLMYYSSLFLMSEVWPDLDGSEWFTGQSSKEIQKESKEYLLHWIDQVAKYGLNEFDSPRYQYYFFTPVVLLAHYTEDPIVKQKSTLLLELMIADYALKYIDGNYIGAHSRTFEAAALTATIGETGAYGEYFFEDQVKNVQPDLGFIAIIGYECPQIIKHIAKKKSYPFEIFESKRERPSMRYELSNKPVAKYTYVDSTLSIGSLSGGIVQPIQQQSWKLVFHDQASPNTITGLHPYRSAQELARFFPEEPSFQAERIEGTKAGYSSENKWVGGSPYEKLYQHENLLIAEYDIPQHVFSQHSQVFIPKSAELQSGADTLLPNEWHSFKYGRATGWIRFAHSVYNLTKEANGIRLRSNSPKSGYAISLAADTVNANKQLKVVRRTAELRKRAAVRVLYRSPYINSKRGSGIITLSHGKQKRVLNFKTGKITER